MSLLLLVPGLRMGGSGSAPPAVEHFSNAIPTTLAGAIVAGDTTITVAATLGFPSAIFRLVINDGTNREIVMCTGITGTTLTVTRAYEAIGGDQTAHGFASGTPIAHVLTAGGLGVRILQG